MRSDVLQLVFSALDKIISEAEDRDERLAILKKLIKRFRDEPEKIFVQDQIGLIVGGRIAIDLRPVNEFDDAIETARLQLASKPRISHYILTSWDHWRIYEVVRDGDIVDLQLIFEGKRDSVVEELENVLANELEELKVPPRSTVIAVLYSIDINELKREMMDVLDSALDDRDVALLFEAYKKIINILYPGEGLAPLKELYVNHTLMHMMVMASLSAALGRNGDEVEVSSGGALPAGLNVALPYLNWWKIAFNRMPEEHQGAIRRIASNIIMRAHMVDWSLDSGEDVFRVLYELLIETRVRRKIGEYYTPSWLADKVLSEFSLKDKIVMDPFCGSGTFLVRAFHKKIMEGEDPDGAYEEVVGFDINPLAVAVARAELIISYVRASNGKLPNTPPRVYHADTLGAWYSEDPLQHDITKLLEVHPDKMDRLLRAAKKMDSKDVLDVIANVERLLAIGISENLEEELADYMINSLSKGDPLESSIREIFEDNDFIRSLTTLKQYGNGVWAAVFSSLMSPIMLNVVRPHIIVTNPPWIHITEFKTSYTKNIHKTFREALMSVIGVTPKRASSIATGSDVATGALYKSIIMARDGVGFVMSKTQSFNSKSPVYAGIVTTYAVLKSTCADCFIKLIDVLYDAFGHGMEPALVITKKGEKREAELYILK